MSSYYKTGKSKVCSWNQYVNFNDSNKAIKNIGAVLDISVQWENELDLTNAKKKAEEGERKFRELFGKFGDAILIITNE
ncbi:MAG: hypothetical protein GY760_07910 [Deltaproteobacteria bacterium]|nr:hypothetical protein [Deltaproteobacteria bacterium]